MNNDMIYVVVEIYPPEKIVGFAQNLDELECWCKKHNYSLIEWPSMHSVQESLEKLGRCIVLDEGKESMYFVEVIEPLVPFS